jgi:hypothetical protein
MIAELESQPKRWSSESAHRRPDRGRVGARRAAPWKGVVEEAIADEPPRVRVRWDDGHTTVFSPAAGVCRIEESKKQLTPAGHEAAARGRLRAQRRARVDEAALDPGSILAGRRRGRRGEQAETVPQLAVDAVAVEEVAELKGRAVRGRGRRARSGRR